MIVTRYTFFIFITLLVSIQCWIFLNRVDLKAAFTPATEEEVYCTNPVVENLRHLGNGLIEFDLSDAGAIIEGGLIVRATNMKNKRIITAQLRAGLNKFSVIVKQHTKHLNIMFTPQNVYDLAGNSNKSYDGVLGIYPSSVCMTRPLKGIYDWAPGNFKKNHKEKTFNSAFIDVLKVLEPLRGVPSKVMESAGIEEIADMVESARGRVWCQQIALYSISKLRNHAPIRLITAGGYYNGDSSIRTGGHDFVEYFDSEADRWVFSDPTNYILSIMNMDGTAISTADLSRINSSENDLSMKNLLFRVADLDSGTIVTKKFDEIPDDLIRELRFHIREDNTFYYHSAKSIWYKRGLIDKILNYVSSDRQFSISRNSSIITVAEFRRNSQIILAVLLIIWAAIEYFAWQRKNRSV